MRSENLLISLTALLLLLPSTEIFLTAQQWGWWILSSAKAINMLAGLGVFGFLFQVAEGFSSYRSNRVMMFPSAVEFAAHSSWMDTWFQGPSAAFSKADARNISPAEKWVGV